jgi:multiple sugar transport system substrate-binding protein
MGKVIEHSLNPKGPKGRFHLLIPVTHGIFSHTPDPQAAKDFLHWVMQPKQLAGWYAAANMYYAPFLHAYDHSPEWNKEPRFKPIQQVLETGRLGGWPAPPDRNLAQVGARWIVSDMFAKACLGASTRTVIAEAMAGLKQIYGET